MVLTWSINMHFQFYIHFGCWMGSQIVTHEDCFCGFVLAWEETQGWSLNRNGPKFGIQLDSTTYDGSNSVFKWSPIACDYQCK